MKVMNGLVITLEEDKRFLCVCEQFCRLANGGARMSIKPVLLHEIFFVSVYSAAVNMFRSLNKVKPCAATLVLGWVTKYEYPVL